jgi:glycosyltransferase involved in cell wall biosynthesis
MGLLPLKSTLRALLRGIGKSETKVAAVFGFDPEGCRQAVAYLRAGTDLPLWLFATIEPAPETAAHCAQVFVNRSSFGLLWEAERRLWQYWVPIGVAVWNGRRGKWPVKLAPFLIPPFRALVMNDVGDFFQGTPTNIITHAIRRTRETAHNAAVRVGELARAYWLLVSYHIWRSKPVTTVKDKAVGVSLWVASLLLRCISLLHGTWHHRLFHRFQGRERLDIPAIASEGNGVMRFCQRGAHWSPSQLEKRLRENDARWLLWLETEQAPAAIEDMLPLFDSERTFAVSRQRDFRDWKPQLLPMAPFRTLQPGEASQVLAPVSSVVLVDRRKLLALGIPRTSLAGTAWMILFWKAGAAGWRSYSAGQSAALEEQPDLPVQETGFLLHWLRHPSVRRLAPQEPGLARGSIAFRMQSLGESVRPANGPLRVLVVSPFLPFPLSHGGAVRIYNLCRALSGRVEFTLAAVREKNEVVQYEKLLEVFREVYIADNDERPIEDDRLPGQVRQHSLPGLRALIADLAASPSKPDLLQIEYTHLATMRTAAPAIPAILVEHDLTFSLYRQLAESRQAPPSARSEYQRWCAFERHWLGVYEGVWTVSEEDRLAAIEESGRAPESTFHVANGVDTERFQPCDEAAATHEIFYVGSFRHLPNIIGFEKLRDEVMPRVWTRYPKARLRVVAGPQHEDFWKRFGRKGPPASDPRVDVHGFVEDLRPLYARASVVVVPLEVSAGTNIKVLEAMACGKAVVSTPIGCAGLGLRHGCDALIEADWEAFGASVADLLVDEARRLRIGALARRTVEERFSWTAVAESAYGSYQSLLTAAGCSSSRRTLVV